MDPGDKADLSCRLVELDYDPPDRASQGIASFIGNDTFQLFSDCHPTIAFRPCRGKVSE